jgi:hypothetical protein
MEQNVYCIGACIHDEHGRFLQAYAKRFHGQPKIAEALELLKVMQWLQAHMEMSVQYSLKLIVCGSYKPLKCTRKQNIIW